VISPFGFILVYSITQRSSFECLEQHYQKMIKTNPAAKFILVGNKHDKGQQREVATEEGYQQARAWGCPFYEVSAKTRHNFEDIFTNLVRILRGDLEKVSPSTNPAPTNKPPKRSTKLPKKCTIM
jgi:GTPase KRas protein